MLAILEPICAGICVSFFNKWLMPIIVQCVEPAKTDEDDTSSETSAINAEVHVHTH
jgi:hypothetical protein